MLGCILALQRWRQYLIGKQFDILTDHTPNQYILSQQKLSCQQVCWVEALLEYTMNFIQKPGQVYSASDALSKIPALKIGQMLQAIRKYHGVDGRVVGTQHAELYDWAMFQAVHQAQQNSIN